MKTNKEIAEENVKGCGATFGRTTINYCGEHIKCLRCFEKAKAHKMNCKEVGCFTNRVEEHYGKCGAYKNWRCKDCKEAIKIYEDNRIR